MHKLLHPFVYLRGFDDAVGVHASRDICSILVRRKGMNGDRGLAGAK